jgi:ABC-type nitrate/sulfonate/bicarbonate transport system substrate-binding protein
MTWIVRVAFGLMTIVTIVLGDLLSGAIASHIEHTRSAPPRHVALFLNWVPEATFSGALYAKASGIWDRQGFEVDVVPGGSDRNPIELVEKIAGSFGIAGADRVMMAISKGSRIVAVAVDFQRSPVAWIVRADSDIHTPRDFEDHRVAIKQDESELIYRALLAKFRVNRRRVHEFPAEFTFKPFLENAADAWPVYVNEEPHVAEAHHVPYRILKPSDYGIDLYGNVLFTSDYSLITEEAAICKFVRGYLEGWRAAVANPDRMLQILKQHVPESEKDEATLRATLKSTFGLLSGEETRPPQLASIGEMTTVGWNRTESFLEKFGFLPGDFHSASVFDRRCLDSAPKMQ